MDTVSNGAVAAITTGIKVKTTPTTKPNPTPKPVNPTTNRGRMFVARPKVPGRGARKVQGKFARKDADEDLLTAYMSKLNLSEPAPVYNFDDMNLKPELLKGIHSKGLEKPAFCQQNVIMPMINGRDIICQAQSGMGKTAAFCISILQRMDLKDPMCKALVLAPTRELAEQILEEFAVIGKHMNVKLLPCIGQKTWYKKNLRHAATGNFNVAVGTVGRIRHLLEEIQPRDDHGIPRPGGMNGDSIKMFVIDEADKMLMDQSFHNDLEFIFKRISSTAQLIVTSATMPSVAFDRCNEVMRNPFTFLLRNDQLTLDGIRQFHVKVGTEEGKLSTLDELFPFLKHAHGIVFCNTRKRAEFVTRKMKVLKHEIEEMTGTMEQKTREDTLEDFRSGKVPVLIASDLLGRGIDIHHVQLVINYDLTTSNEEYIHRIGRAGRYGKKGVAISFVTDTEVTLDRIKTLEQFYQTQIPELRATIGDLMNELK